MTAHLRMNAVYWGLTALCIMKHKDALDAEETIEYVMSCWDDETGARTNLLTSLQPPPSSPRARIYPVLAAQTHTKNSTFNIKKVPSAHTRDTTHTSFPR
jgi:hypothetical protein